MGRTLNYKQITKLVEPNSRILDLGSGDGYLFKKLVDEKNVKGVGVEINQEEVIKAMEKDFPLFRATLTKV